MSLTIRAAGILSVLSSGQEPPSSDSRVKVLFQALRNPSWKARYDAAVELGSLGDRAVAAVPDLIEALDDDHLGVRTALVDALAAIGAVAAPALVESFGDSRWRVRFGASRALKKMGEAALPSLHRGLEHPNAAIREESARTLRLMN